jgi:5-formyltetrahydrofolate cyclo-ligase
MLKSELRKRALAQRNALSEQQFDAFNLGLLAQFKQLDLSAVKSIHVFLPIISKKEPDTFLIIDYLERSHPEIVIVVSKSDFKTSLLGHFTYAGKADLMNNHYHIPEPQTAKPFDGKLDMVLVPLLAFDKKGYRVGYGKGFYDRFLNDINTIKVGVSFFDGVDEIIDVHLNDIKLDMCITPDKLISFKNID